MPDQRALDAILNRVLYRDGLILVLDKPAGLPVHAGPGGGETLDDYLDSLRFGLPRPPALAHRLDRDTSGCLVLGRHPKALRRLGRIFAEGRAEKTYWAVVRGRPPQKEGRIDLPLAKLNRPQGWRMVVDPAGQKAVSDYRVLGKGPGMTWLEVKPRTGRTHQIRVHCAQMGTPLLGDATYGQEAEKAGIPMQLHARAIALPLYPKRESVVVEAPVPPQMVESLTACGWGGEGPGET